MSRSFVRSFVALILLLVLIVAALPALAGNSPAPQRAVPGWQELSPPTGRPLPRASHAMAYDIDRGVAVLFGGADSNGNALGDTWEYISASGEWIERTPSDGPSPPARYGHVMVYDEARKVTFLFSGYHADTHVWLWDGNDWSEVATDEYAPSTRWLASVTYDAQREVVVFFGGNEPGVAHHGDLWTWDGSAWTKQAVTGPAPRAGAFMAYDRRRHVHTLFGGHDLFNVYKDTWELTPEGEWQNVTPPQKSPSRRGRGGAVYLPQIQRVFLYGGIGFTYHDDSYTWGGQRWATKIFNPAPPGRCCTAMVYDPVQQGALLFGGSVSWIEHNDTWLFGVNP